MATQRRPWPNAALQARDGAIMELTLAKEKLRYLVEETGRLKPIEQLRCEAIALGATAEALRLLQGTVDNGNNNKE